MSGADAAGPANDVAVGAWFIPPMPVVAASEMYLTPTLLVQQPGRHLNLGWQYRDPEEGGPCFVIARYTVVSGYRVLEAFPLTEQGWADAWRALLLRDNTLTAPLIRVLHARAVYAQLDSRTMVTVQALTYLGGHTPGVELTAGQPYDVRYLTDKLIVLPTDRPDVLHEVRYRDIEVVGIGGPGLVRSGGGYIGGGSGLVGAVEGMAIAAALNAITTRSTIRTVMRVQAADCEMFWLCTSVTPDSLRIHLSHPLSVIRSSTGQRIAVDARKPTTAEELSMLGSLLDRGLVTRDEFDQIKSRIMTQE